MLADSIGHLLFLRDKLLLRDGSCNRRNVARLSINNWKANNMSVMWKGRSLSCDREFSDCRQQTCFVQSPNYPGVYPRNRRCLYHISTRQPFIKVKRRPLPAQSSTLTWRRCSVDRCCCTRSTLVWFWSSPAKKGFFLYTTIAALRRRWWIQRRWPAMWQLHHVPTQTHRIRVLPTRLHPVRLKRSSRNQFNPL